MSRQLRVLAAGLSGLMLVSVARTSLAADVPTVLVVPAKPSVVAFCADVAAMKSAELVSYVVGKKTNEPALTLNLWNGQTADWTKVGIEEYRSGGIFREMPRRVVLVGNNAAIVAELKGASADMGAVNTLSSLDTMSLANGLNEILDFSASQWRALARRYELKLKDLNDERRRYGRYGPPGGRPAVRIPEADAEPVRMPTPMELPPAETAKPAPRPTAPQDK